MHVSTSQPITLSYANVDGVDIKFDVYVPLDAHGPIPAVLYFHGGGCFSGSRKNEGISYFPWMERKALERGYLFVSADYRLLHPFTGMDELEDVQRLFQFLDSECNTRLEHAGATVTLDTNKIAVIGESGGGYIARLAALHAMPRPAVLVSLYGMGGDLLSDFWLNAHDAQYVVPRERVTRFLATEPTKETEMSIFAQGGLFTDVQRRVDAFTWISQEGLFLDYLTGIHGLSERLRTVPHDQRASMLPKGVQKVFPELSIDASLRHPPILFVHSKADAIVPLSESLKTERQLREVGVRTELFILDGATHGQVKTDKLPIVGAGPAEEAVFRFIDSVLRA